MLAYARYEKVVGRWVPAMGMGAGQMHARRVNSVAGETQQFLTVEEGQ